MADSKDWAGDLGATWAETIEAMDAQLAPATEHGLSALAAQPGERIIDLGCGGGPTTLQIADEVGPEGHVMGLDISPALASIAASRGEALAQMEVVVADAATFAFETAAYDALFSRFGCMFFDEPIAAFQNLRGALKTGGRAVFTVWAEPKYNPWAMIPASVGHEILGPAEKLPPGAPGPFGWATPEIFEPILSGAGFADLSYTEHEIEMAVGYGSDEDPIDRAVALAARIGPLARRLEEAPPEMAAKVLPVLRAKMTPFVKGGRVVLNGRIRVIRVTA